MTGGLELCEKYWWVELCGKAINNILDKKQLTKTRNS